MQNNNKALAMYLASDVANAATHMKWASLRSILDLSDQHYNNENWIMFKK